MALLDAHGNPIATPNPGPAPAAAAHFINVNQLKTAFSNPKADIPIIYGDSALECEIPVGQNQNCTHNVRMVR